MPPIFAPPTVTGKKPGVIVPCGDSLTQPFPADVVGSAWYNQANLYLKTYPPTTRAGFGWGWDNISTPSSINIINAAYDPDAPWNLCIPWCGAADVAAGVSPADTYAKAQHFASLIDPRFHLLCVTMIPRSTPAQSVIDAYNALLKTPPYVGAGVVAGAGVIDLTSLNGNPLVITDQTYYQADHIHLRRMGDTVCANLFSSQISAYVLSLP